MKAHPAEVINKLAELSGTGSMTEKKRIIKEYSDVEEFKKVIEYALNPFKNFYIMTVPGLNDIANGKNKQKGFRDLDQEETNPTLPWKQQFSTMFELLDNLSSRKLPPNSSQARNAVLEWAKKVGPGTISCFRKIINKDLRCSVGAKTFNKIVPNWVPVFDIQLAIPFDEKKLSFPCYVDPKYDGERCLAFIAYDGDEGSIMYFSRNGIQFQNYGCFDKELLNLFKDYGACVVDCEVINKHGFQTLQKVPTNFDPTFDSSNLCLVAFDLIDQCDFEKLTCNVTEKDRFNKLSEIFKKRRQETKMSDRSDRRVSLVEREIANNFKEAQDIYSKWVAQGLEGIILKQIEGQYTFSRSDSWCKLKPSSSEELKIVGIELGDDKKKWAGKCGSLIVERMSKTGKTAGNIVRVNVASGLTDIHHENITENNGNIFYKDPDGQMINIKGKLVEVVYDCETEDGSLRFPRIKATRQLIRTDK